MAVNELYKQAQKRLIGSLLADGEGVNGVLEAVTIEDFEEPSLQLIFESIVNVSRIDEDVTIISVAKNLDSLGNLTKVGGAAELYSLQKRGKVWRLEAPSELYASIVKEYSAKTRITEALKEHEELLKPDSGYAASTVISQIQGGLNTELYRLSDESTVYELGGSMDEYFKILAERNARSKANEDGAAGLQGIPCLLPTLNEYTSGWLPGQLITVGARTGVGKSVFAVNSAVAAAQAGKSVLFFSLEMGEQELKDRMISSMTGIPLDHLKKGTLTEEELELLHQHRPEVDGMNVLFDTDPNISVDTIRARALRRAQSPAGLDIIIVDYLQLIKPVGHFSSRQEAVADISRNMKLLAKQLQVPIMVLVQVNRGGAKDDEEDNVPRLDGIRESGAIAQDSDIVILLHREQTMDDTIPHTLVILAKNRGGVAEKTIRCHSNLECSLFREVQRARDVENTITDEDIAALDSYDDDDDLDFDDDL